MEIESIQVALENLALPQNRPIAEVFGRILEKRSTQRDPSCFIFRLLEHGSNHYLRQLNDDCDVFSRELGAEEARRKCEKEVKGVVSRPPKDFNRRCGDFLSEMAAIRELRKDGFTDFKAIYNQFLELGTHDYVAARGTMAARIEVKNLHANETVLDVLSRSLAGAHEREPAGFPFHLGIDYPYDNYPTAAQERTIRDFVVGLRGLKPPFRTTLDLADAIASIEVTEGQGTAHLTRGGGGSWPEPLNYHWLLGKVRAKAEDARSQFPNGDYLKVLVVNIDSPSGMLSFDFLRQARDEAKSVIGGDVLVYLLLYGHLARVLSNVSQADGNDR